MGAADDGLDLAVRAVAAVVHGTAGVPGRDDCHFAFVGDGEERSNTEKLAVTLDVQDHVSFPGWSSMDVVHDYLATATLGMIPDPKTSGVDKATVMKVMEYMAFEVPIVAFDVVETKVSAGDAGSYSSNNDPLELANAIRELLDDPARRANMGRVGRRRVEDALAWDHQVARYLSVFERVVG
jgi:asparagine synthase (glutamine-hydrolysing)